MRNLYLVSAVGFSTILFSNCTSKLVGNHNFISEERKVQDFTRLESDGAFNVMLIPGDGNTITIDGESNILPEISADVEGQTLIIGYKNDLTELEHGDITVKVPVQSLKSVSQLGSGSIMAMDTVYTSDFEIEMNGSGKVEMLYVGNHVGTSLSGSGKVLLGGRASSSKITISGSGNVKSYELKTSTTTVDISGSGDAEVNPAQALDVSISGSGTVTHMGSPQVRSSISGSGKIRQR